jgi:hypothetical protein
MKYRMSNIKQVVSRFIIYFKQLEISPSDEEMSDLWDKIEHSITLKQKRTKHFRIWSSTAIAASLITCAWIGIYYFPNKETDLTSVAKIMLEQEIATDEIQLLVSPEKILQIDNKSTVAYSQKGTIEVNKHEIDISTNKGQAYNQFIVPKGKIGKLILADGSKLFVNSDTRVVYPKSFENDKREIFVEGEIYIEVTKRENMPFVVKTAQFDVQVLGTAFNIKTYTNKPLEGEVVLLRGAVKIKNSKGMESKLFPNNKATISTNGNIEKTKVNAENYIWWTKGILLLNNKKLSDIVKELTQYFDVNIICDKSIENVRIAGKIDIENGVEAALKYLSSTSGFIYQKQGNIYMILSADKE